MNNPTTAKPHPEAPDPQPPLPDHTGPRQTLTARLVQETFRRLSARIGATWIAALAFVAIFAPFLANSHPILIRWINGQWSSPLLAHLTAADLSILAAAAIVVTLAGLRRIAMAKKILIFFGVMTVTIVACIVFVHPPQAVVYSQYRELDAEGKIKWAIYTPIPFHRLTTNGIKLMRV